MNARHIVMRVVVAWFAVFCFVLAGARAARATPPKSIELKADRVVFYSDRYIVTGEGHVRVVLSVGTRVSGDLFSMDLKLNRYLIAGNVHLDSGNVHELGAGFAGYLDIDRSYFISANGNPDRWTYFGLDFTKPNKGRAQPGDAFYIPDLSAAKPYIYAGSATILPKTLIDLHDSRVSLLGVDVPTKNFVQVFSANSNYAQNGFAGADFDIGLPFAASEHAVSAIHFRHTGLQGYFLSFDQHFVWGPDYVVFSINPASQTLRQFNLIGYDRVTPKLEVRLFSQLTTQQDGIYQPTISSAYNQLSIVKSLRQSSVQFLFNQYNPTLLHFSAEQVANGQEDESFYDHPSNALITWYGRDHILKKGIPINFRLRSGFGWAHDGYHCGPHSAFCPTAAQLAAGDNTGYVLDYFGKGDTPVPTIYQKFAGATLYTNSIKFYKNYAFNLVFDKQRQYWSLPHYTDTTTTTASVSNVYSPKFTAFGAYSVENLADIYGARQLEFYPPDPIVVGTTDYFGYEAFRGISTTRSLTGSGITTANPRFSYIVTVRRNYDFPAPIPGVFGNAPWQLTNEVRVRIASHLLLDASRTDYFNWGGFTPQYNVVFGP